jgi:hypothetical protein
MAFRLTNNRQHSGNLLAEPPAVTSQGKFDIFSLT